MPKEPAASDASQPELPAELIDLILGPAREIEARREREHHDD